MLLTSGWLTDRTKHRQRDRKKYLLILGIGLAPLIRAHRGIYASSVKKVTFSYRISSKKTLPRIIPAILITL